VVGLVDKERVAGQYKAGTAGRLAKALKNVFVLRV
jgi:hypothetical protein